MSVSSREPDRRNDEADTFPRCTDSGVSLRSPPIDFPYYIAPHLLAQRVLGEGGSAVVFEALHTRLKVRVAVKMLKPSGTGTAAARERMQREAELCARMDNPRIPRVYDVDTLPDGTTYMVMEEVHGRSLEEVLRNGPLEVDLACAIGRDLLEALSELHGAGIVHRDIKPSNLILEDHGTSALRVRILDLGIAQTLLSTATPGAAPRLTLAGTLLGTPHYMASEQLLGAEVDQRTDLYAVGVMLYEMLAGVPPFDGESVSQVIASAMRHEPADLSVLREGLPRSLLDLVMRAMQREPALRYASAGSMLEDLLAVETEEAEEVALPLVTPAALAPRTLDRILHTPESMALPAAHTVNAQWARRALHSLSEAQQAGQAKTRGRMWMALALCLAGASLAIGWPSSVEDKPAIKVTRAAQGAQPPRAATVPTPPTPPVPEPVDLTLPTLGTAETNPLRLQLRPPAWEAGVRFPELSPRAMSRPSEPAAPAPVVRHRARAKRNVGIPQPGVELAPALGRPLNPYLESFDATLRSAPKADPVTTPLPPNPYPTE